MSVEQIIIGSITVALLAGGIAIARSLWLGRKLIEATVKNVRLENQLTDVNYRHALVTNNIAASVILRATIGETVFCSPYTEVLTGYPLEEIGMSGDFLETICLEEDRPRYLRARQVCELGEDSLVRYQIRHRSGMRLWLETRMVPLITESGDVESILSVTIDVTASVNHQQQIEEKNRDLSDFAYMVSHDLKAPIFTIKGMATALREDFSAALGTEGAELLRYIEDAGERLERLVSSVIEYSSVSGKVGQIAEVSLNAVFSDVLRDHAQQIRDAKAVIDLPSNLPVICGEPIRIYQVFANLVNNALKYRSAGRPPVITIRAVPSRTRAVGQDLIAIEVSDNGLGIPAARVEDIFRPYQRAHNHTGSGIVVEGNGIGLACVKKIAERLGGSVSVKSIEGEGSTFRVLLPLAQPEPQSIPAELARSFQI